eukprot:COSAG04_NODE_562_length_12576_cov_154.338703_11_plen_233_part_00
MPIGPCTVHTPRASGSAQASGGGAQAKRPAVREQTASAPPARTSASGRRTRASAPPSAVMRAAPGRCARCWPWRRGPKKARAAPARLTWTGRVSEALQTLLNSPLNGGWQAAVSIWWPSCVSCPKKKRPLRGFNALNGRLYTDQGFLDCVLLPASMPSRKRMPRGVAVDFVQQPVGQRCVPARPPFRRRTGAKRAPRPSSRPRVSVWRQLEHGSVAWAWAWAWAPAAARGAG